MTSAKALVYMTEEELRDREKRGLYQCLIEAESDGEICWCEDDTREREPIHKVKRGERFWVWHFKDVGDGYTHDYADMAPSDVKIKTDVKLKLVYLADDCDDPELFKSELDKSPNWT